MARARSELKSTGYEIFIGVLSLLSIANIVMMYTIVNDDALDAVLWLMNGLFSVIFLVDFTYRLVTAPQRGAYFFRHFGWADLLASIPLPQLKILRVFRLMRVFRLLRELGPRAVVRTLVNDRAGSALFALLIMGVLVLQFGSLVMLYVEQYAPGANITTASDALWYTVVTISTVGYGDQYPVTDLGRIFGGVIIVVGVGIFGTFTGYLANLFLSPRKDLGDEGGERPAAEAAVPATTTEEPAAIAPAAPGVTDAGAADASKTLDDVRALLTRSEADLETIKHLLGRPETGPG